MTVARFLKMDDVLSDVLATMRVNGTVYFCDPLQAPWTKKFENTTTASFHQIRRGGCWLLVGEETKYLGPGDVVFLEQGLDHILTSRLAGQKPSAPEPDTLLLCGYLEFNDEAGAPLQDLFPQLSILREQDIQRNPWMKATLDQLAAEHMSGQPGAKLVLNRLTEVLVVEMIRSNFGSGEDTRYIRALNDRFVGRALQRLHTRPEQHWTLQSLASEIGMSRAGLARRFKELVGSPMFDYLTGLRMQKARGLLRETGLSLYDVANRVGYESDIAFTKAFKKRTGMTPTAYRRAR